MGDENLTVGDLAGVVYSSGKVFDGLSTGRLDTENFLRSGNLDGVTSRHDLNLLEDLRDAAQYVIDHLGARVDVDFVRGLNATLTRSGSIEPGRFRRADAGIGVDTVYGRHEPPAQTQAALQDVIHAALGRAGVREQAVALFISVAKAQPFGDGNKRTALFAAKRCAARFWRACCHDHPRRRGRSRCREGVQRPPRLRLHPRRERAG